jgi:transposase-like protein
MTAAALVLNLPSPIVAAPHRKILISPAAQLQANHRLDALNLILSYQRDPQRFGHLHLADSKPITSYSRMVEYVAETHGVNIRTLYRWLRDYKTGGLPALADKTRQGSYFFAAYPKAAWLAESMSQRRHLEKQTRNTLSAITLVARKNGAQTPLEAMAQRLQLPADTDLDDVEWMLSVPAQHPLAGGAPLR